MTHPSAPSPEPSAASLDAPAVPTGAPEAAAAPRSLPDQIIERFVASLSGEGGVSPATAAALGALLPSRASPSREVILRAVQEAIEAAGNSTSSAAPESAAVESGP